MFLRNFIFSIICNLCFLFLLFIFYSCCCIYIQINFFLYFLLYIEPYFDFVIRHLLLLSFFLLLLLLFCFYWRKRYNDLLIFMVLLSLSIFYFLLYFLLVFLLLNYRNRSFYSLRFDLIPIDWLELLLLSKFLYNKFLIIFRLSFTDCFTFFNFTLLIVRKFSLRLFFNNWLFFLQIIIVNFHCLLWRH